MWQSQPIDGLEKHGREKRIKKKMLLCLNQYLDNGRGWSETMFCR